MPPEKPKEGTICADKPCGLRLGYYYSLRKMSSIFPFFIFLEKYGDVHLIPDVEQHDILFIQVILIKVCNLCCYKATRLIGALK